MSMFCGYSLDELIARGLKVGKHFNMQPDCFIDYSHCWLIEIGDNVIFAPRVHVIAHDASMLNFTGYTKIGRVTIGSNVFVGNNAMILPGVAIGDNVVVGAGSVVTKNIPNSVVVAGNPAKVICSIEQYLENTNKNIQEAVHFDTSWTIEGGISEEMKAEMKNKLNGSIGFMKIF